MKDGDPKIDPGDCFGWSARAWARPWRAMRRDLGARHWVHGLELGAGPQSSMAPLMLALADQVECSVHDPATLPAVRERNAQLLTTVDAHRLQYTSRDLRALEGRWDLIVMKSVLGGVHREHQSTLSDVHATLKHLIEDHLQPGGALITLDNGCTGLSPLLARFGARRNGWRFFEERDFPEAQARYSFGVLSNFSAATRLGWVGHRLDDALYAFDLMLSPLFRRHAVHLHVYRREP